MMKKNNLPDESEVLLDETLRLLEDYEEGVPAKDILGMSDCAHCLGEVEEMNVDIKLKDSIRVSGCGSGCCGRC